MAMTSLLEELRVRRCRLQEATPTEELPLAEQNAPTPPAPDDDDPYADVPCTD
jgi:hypothetical protein